MLAVFMASNVKVPYKSSTATPDKCQITSTVTVYVKRWFPVSEVSSRLTAIHAIEKCCCFAEKSELLLRV